MEPNSKDPHQSEKQKCAICLEDLFQTANDNKTRSVGAVVPCGHIFHEACIHAWYTVQRHHLSSTSRTLTTSRSSNACPMCKRPSQTFVKLFLDEPVDPVIGEKTNSMGEGHIATTKSTGAAFGNTDAQQEGSRTASTEELLAQQVRVNNKLARCKRQNKKLKEELQSERTEMEDMMVSTIQNFYKIVDRHEEKCKRWNRHEFELRQELDATVDQLSKERSEWKAQQQLMLQEVEKIKKDCALAEQNVQSAAIGLATMKLSQTKHQSRLQVLQQEKSQLAHANRKLKKTILGSHGTTRPECILW